MNDAGTLGAFVIAILLLAVLAMKMDGETLALIGACMLFFIICRREMRDKSDMPTSEGFEDSSAQSNVQPEPDVPSRVVTAEHSDLLAKDQRPPEPVYPGMDDTARARVMKSNRLAVSELYGRRHAGTMDNALYVHKQRIGDRDRQATINQIRSRRNNVYEPYYRQELSEAERSGGWWKDNDDVLMQKLERRQLATIDMGRFNLDDRDMTGIYQ
jgi:hypothetical protein